MGRLPGYNFRRTNVRHVSFLNCEPVYFGDQFQCQNVIAARKEQPRDYLPVLFRPVQDPASLLDGKGHVCLHFSGCCCEEVLPGLELICERGRVATNLCEEC